MIQFDKKADVWTESEVEMCHSEKKTVFVIVLYGIKGCLLIYGAIMAFETRHATVSEVNDSKMVSVAIFNTLLMSVVGVSVSAVFTDKPDLKFMFEASVITVAALVTSLIVFIPKVMALVNGSRQVGENDGSVLLGTRSNTGTFGGNSAQRATEPMSRQVATLKEQLKILKDKYTALVSRTGLMKHELERHTKRGCLSKEDFDSLVKAVSTIRASTKTTVRPNVSSSALLASKVSKNNSFVVEQSTVRPEATLDIAFY